MFYLKNLCKSISFRLPRDLDSFVDEMSRERGITRSQFCRSLVKSAFIQSKTKGTHNENKNTTLNNKL